MCVGSLLAFCEGTHGGTNGPVGRVGGGEVGFSFRGSHVPGAGDLSQASAGCTIPPRERVRPVRLSLWSRRLLRRIIPPKTAPSGRGTNG